MTRPNVHQRGAAILTAMLTVALVAALSAAALWQQWRGIEIEVAERERLQSAWILQGALDWARLILREDAKSGGGGGTDHLAEPWAVPLQEARLSTFLAAGQNEAGGGQGLEEAFLSGQIADMQGRLNVLGLVRAGQPDPSTLQAFTRLFVTLQLPRGELISLVTSLQAAQDSSAAQANGGNGPAAAPLLPRSTAELGWLGLSPPTIKLLSPYVALLPGHPKVNLNTAPVEVLHATLDGISMADAQRLVAARAQTHFGDVDAVKRVLGGQSEAVQPEVHGVASSWFAVSGQVRLGTRTVQEHSLVQRNNQQVSVVWRERGAGVAVPANAAVPSLQ